MKYTPPPGNHTIYSAANAFAATFGTPRQVDRRTIRGVWTGREYRGTFQLADGIKTYSIRHTPAEGWTISDDNEFNAETAAALTELLKAAGAGPNNPKSITQALRCPRVPDAIRQRYLNATKICI